MLNRETYSLRVYFIICILCQAAYQKQFVFGTTCMLTTSGCDNDYLFCIGNHHTTMIATFKTFLQDAQLNCKDNVKHLMVLYSNLIITSANSVEDCYNLLLRRELRKNFIKLVVSEINETFNKQPWAPNRELDLILTYIYNNDKSAAKIILEQVSSSLWSSKEPEEVIKDIRNLPLTDLKLMAFEYLFNNYISDNEQAMTLMPLLTFEVHKLYDKTLDSYTYTEDKDHLYNRLPEKLRQFYESSNKYNIFYNFTTRGNMLAPNTWLFDDNGLVAFTYNKSDSLDYLHVKQHDVTYGLSTDVKSNQWWHVIMTSRDHLMFCNDDTKDLLCAEGIFDEIKFTLLNYKNNMKNSACQWIVASYTSWTELVSVLYN